MSRELPVTVNVPDSRTSYSGYLSFEQFPDPTLGFGKLVEREVTPCRIEVQGRDRAVFDSRREGITGYLRFAGDNSEQALIELSRHTELGVGARSGGETHWLTFR